MRNRSKLIICVSIFISLLVSTFSIHAAEFTVIQKPDEETVEKDDSSSDQNNTELKKLMSQKQMSSVAMLNHMTVLSQEINSSKNSRLFLDNAYSDIVNNINPNAVDEDTMSQIRILLNTIYSYQSIETKRDRLQYIYEQNQANAVQKAIPNPLSVLNVIQADNPLKSLASIVFLAIDSASSYQSYISEVDNKYLQDGWILDDEAASNLHESRKETFSYMVEMCQKYALDGKLALNEKSVENFVNWENNSNLTRRIDFLEKNVETYKAYGKYWRKSECVRIKRTDGQDYKNVGNRQACFNL